MRHADPNLTVPDPAMRMRRRLNLAAEHGYTMVAVMLVMLATSMLAGAAFAAVGGDIPFARAAQDRKQAYAAAEAGRRVLPVPAGARQRLLGEVHRRSADPRRAEPGADQQARRRAARRWRDVSGTTDARFSIELLPANGAAECDPTKPETTMLDTRVRHVPDPLDRRVARRAPLDRVDAPALELPRLPVLHRLRDVRPAHLHERGGPHERRQPVREVPRRPRRRGARNITFFRTATRSRARCTPTTTC